MDVMSILAEGYSSWYYLLTIAGLIGVIIFYSMYRRNQM